MNNLVITHTTQDLLKHNPNYYVNGEQLYNSIEEFDKKQCDTAKTPIDDTPTAELHVNEFVDLTYMEVQINLRFLGDLKEGEKVMISDGRFMQVDQRYIQTARRWWTADSRSKTLHFISHLIELSKKYCTEAVNKINQYNQKQINLEKLINLQKLLGNAITGLGRLIATYGDDKLNLATIETFKSAISVFCDQDLKKALSDHE